MGGARRILPLGLVLALALVTSPVEGHGQEPPTATVRVRQVAGSTVYLDLGARHGLATGDTVEVSVEPGGPIVGHLIVTAATEVRSVLSGAGEGLPVVRGQVLVLHLVREPLEPPPPVDGPNTPSERPEAAESGSQARRQTGALSATRRSAYGHVALDLQGSRTVTSFGGSDAEHVTRSFATPAFRLDLTAPQAVGGFTFRLSGRLAYRYSSTSAIDPPGSARVYAASIERTFSRVPLRFRLGRFHSPVESYSGFWDGLFLRVGGRAAGVGVLVGFEPDRWNEAPSTNRPKLSAFVDLDHRGHGWRWHADLSGHAVRPRDGFPDHTFMGLSQRISAGPFALTQDGQVDRDQDGTWRLGRLRVQASLALTRRLQVDGGFLRREEFRFWRTEDLFAPRTDRLTAGFAFRWSGGGLRASVSTQAGAVETRSWGFGGSLDTGVLPGLGIGGSAAAATWSGPYGRTLTVSPGLAAAIEEATLRLAYRFYRADFLDRITTTHAAEGSLDVPLGPALRATVRGRMRWGNLRADALQITLRRSFGR